MNRMLKIYSAGVVKNLATKTAELWNTQYPSIPAQVHFGGSVDGIRRLLSGEPFDLMLFADDTIISSMLMPKYTDGYYVFAGNKMVICAMGEKEITSKNWQERLLAPDATFVHNNPYGDPGGYRAIMSMLLADYIEPGLTQKLLYHPGHMGMEPDFNLHNAPQADYMFYYYTGAIARGLPFAELPPVMNLSDDALADIYRTVSFRVDDDNIVYGTPIAHAMHIPLASSEKNAAREFSKLFLKNDFAAAGFINRSKVIGNWQ